MKRIAFHLNGSLVILSPAEGARLCYALVPFGDTSYVRQEGVQPVPADRFLRTWPVDGYTADWAETEDEFVARIMVKDVPADATDVTLLDPAGIPADRSNRNNWRLVNGAIVTE